jgi:4-hydroxymandelate oxidase
VLATTLGLGVRGRAWSAQLSDQQKAGSGDDLKPGTSLIELESLARNRMSHAVFERVNGGAGDEITLKWNREAYDRIRLRPRVLVDVSRLDTKIKLFGQDLPFPILLAPTGGHALIHPEGEIATVRGAGQADSTLVISTSASLRVEEIAKAATRPVWFQLYVDEDRERTRDLVQRAEGVGCRVLCVTVDSPINGVRNREESVQAELPVRARPNQKAAVPEMQTISTDKYRPVRPAKLTWRDIDWLRSFARTPVILKGVLNPEDADLAVKAGVSGLIVSNHGARQLDTVPSTIDALPIVTQRVAGRVPVLVDGGVRRGTDVLKAIALGASAVLIGRPYLYGLSIAGSAGVSAVVNILRHEFEVAMALSGRSSIGEIDASVLW